MIFRKALGHNLLRSREAPKFDATCISMEGAMLVATSSNGSPSRQHEGYRFDS